MLSRVCNFFNLFILKYFPILSHLKGRLLPYNTKTLFVKETCLLLKSRMEAYMSQKLRGILVEHFEKYKVKILKYSKTLGKKTTKIYWSTAKEHFGGILLNSRINIDCDIDLLEERPIKNLDTLSRALTFANDGVESFSKLKFVVQMKDTLSRI